ncbi:MAG TPA: DUF1572 family protein [Gemmatimonadales bacterium]|nr:DUF1572 family protein [Gemmatimonadales bacterium]
MAEEIGAVYLRDVTERFRAYKRLGERAMAQVYDSGLTARVDPASNSIAVLVRHLAGNMRSRWTGFLTSDGEKPDRHREQEFEMPESVTRREMLEWWDDGWARLFEALVALQPADLTRQVTIRGQPYLALQAIDVALTHYAYHVGQIVLLAKHLAGDSWTSLTIPRPSQG